MRLVSPQQAGLTSKFALWSLAAIGLLLLPTTPSAQVKRYSLESVAGLRLHNVVAEPAVLQGKKGLRVTHSEEAQRRLQTMTPEEQARFPQLAVIEGLEFDNGVIEAEIAGTPAPGAGGDARGFVGLAFRLQTDAITYDAFYLRPTNGRADDQERRNHTAQYIPTPIGRGFGCGRRPPPDTNRMSISCLAYGPG